MGYMMGLENGNAPTVPNVFLNFYMKIQQQRTNSRAPDGPGPDPSPVRAA